MGVVNIFWFKKDTTEENTRTLFKHLEVISDDNIYEIADLIRKVYIVEYMRGVRCQFDNVRDQDGNNALHLICAACKSLDSCSDLIFLAINRIDINYANNKGETGLYIICKIIQDIEDYVDKDACIKMVCILLQRGADMYIPAYNGVFPMDIAECDKRLKNLLMNYDRMQKNIYN
jgi:hypothetical protein